MEIDTKIAEVARECNRLNTEFADIRYRRAMNVLFTDTGEPFVIDEKIISEYNKREHELSAKIDELKALKERKYEAT